MLLIMIPKKIKAQPMRNSVICSSCLVGTGKAASWAVCVVLLALGADPSNVFQIHEITALALRLKNVAVLQTKSDSVHDLLSVMRQPGDWRGVGLGGAANVVQNQHFYQSTEVVHNIRFKENSAIVEPVVAVDRIYLCSPWLFLIRCREAYADGI